MALLACASPPRPVTLGPATASEETVITETLARALQSDPTTQPADDLFSPHAVVIADGEMRRIAPRFAGVSMGGQVAIGTTQFEVRNGIAFGSADYRWLSIKGSMAREGWATFVLAPSDGKWLILQAHSSTIKGER